MELNNNQRNNDEKCIYSVCAVVFRTDETVIDLPLNDGFSFVRRSLIPYADHLDKVFDMTESGLRNEFYPALINPGSTMDVICVEKELNINLSRAQLSNWFNIQTDKDIVSLDNQIRSIRLYMNCHIFISKISFKVKSQDNKMVYYSAITPIKEPANSQSPIFFHCKPDELPSLRKALTSISFPFGSESLNTAHLLYDLSFHLENKFALLLLIIALEAIFLNDEANKKECLSKRCSVFLHDDRENRLLCYNRLRKAYALRSTFVHEGKSKEIDDEIVSYVRKCVRDVLVSSEVKNINKSLLITELKGRVEKTDYWKS